MKRPDFDKMTAREQAQAQAGFNQFLANEMSLQKRHKQISSARSQLEAGRPEGEVECKNQGI